MQKARRHSLTLLRPLVSARFQVLFHSAVRGAFHLSLTVLVHYRSLRSIQPCQMVLAVSRKISRVPRYSGFYLFQVLYVYRTFTFSGGAFQHSSTSSLFYLVVLLPQTRLNAFGLGSYLFARHYSGNHCCFLFLRLLRCFSSAGSLLFRCHFRGGFPHSDIRGLTAICASPRLFAACHVLLRL